MRATCFLCQRELPTHSDVCEAAALYQRVADLTEESCGLEDEIGEYKDASVLMAGGDPGGVTPALLREHQGMSSDVILAAKRFMDARADDNATFMDLKAKLATYLERWPEQ